jgi:hypothetical protein
MSKIKRYPPTTPDNINPYEAMDFIRDNADELGRLKGLVYGLTEMRKSVKAELMLSAIDCKTESAKESYAYASQAYKDHVKKTEDAIAEYTTLQTLMSAAEAKLEAWRSIEASARNEIRLSQ